MIAVLIAFREESTSCLYAEKMIYILEKIFLREFPDTHSFRRRAHRLQIPNQETINYRHYKNESQKHEQDYKRKTKPYGWEIVLV